MFFDNDHLDNDKHYQLNCQKEGRTDSNSASSYDEVGQKYHGTERWVHGNGPKQSNEYVTYQPQDLFDILVHRNLL